MDLYVKEMSGILKMLPVLLHVIFKEGSIERGDFYNQGNVRDFEGDGFSECNIKRMQYLKKAILKERGFVHKEMSVFFLNAILKECNTKRR